MQISAAVLRDQGAPYSIEDVVLPPLRPDEILVRIVSAGICHTDTLLRQLPSAPLPMITGHEGAGIVQEIGPQVVGIEVGDHVVLSYDSCGTCRNCRAAATSYCDEFMIRNMYGRRLDGSADATDARGESVGSRWFGQSSFATHAIASHRNAVVIDRSLDLTLLGPLGCGLPTGAGSILNVLRVRPGASLVVCGAGTVGLAAVMAGRIAGASTIVAVDRHRHRLDLAATLGATHVIDTMSTEELGGALQAATGGGADFALDTTGVPAVVAAAVAGLRTTGTCGLVGVASEPLALDMNRLMGRTVMGILEGDSVPQVFIPQLIELWKSGRFPFEQLIKTYPLAAINEAERASLSGDVVKAVLLPET